MSKTFMITGVSGGLGRAFATAALDAGHRVAGPVYQPDQGARSHRIGPIDVLVASADYGLEGTVEESSMAQVRHQFDVNVYGTIAAVQAVPPHMRRRGRGHIVTISSMAGRAARPGVAF